MVDNELALAGIEGHSHFSEDERYRYWLTREWSGSPSKLLFICLNPSIANDMIDDPTQRRIRGFAKSWGFGGYTVVNLFAVVSTDPSKLRRVLDPVGPENDLFLRRLHQDSEVSVAAWGAHGACGNRGILVMKMLGAIKPLMCLGLNRDGSPKHPLYLKGDSILLPFYPPKVCPRCGYDHDRPQNEVIAMRILACVMPEDNFVNKHEETNPSGGNRTFYVTGGDSL